MKLLLQRHPSNEVCTTGDLYLDGRWLCYTLEDVVRTKKIKGKTAIPAGIYKIIINYSKRFKKMMPLLLNVPNYEGIRIHTLNTANQTEGCIGVGFTKSINFIGKSREAFETLMPKLEQGLKDGEVEITIIDAT